MRKLGVAVLVAATVGPATASHAEKFAFKPFVTPSKNIECAFLQSGKHIDVRCDIRSQDNPMKPRPKSCEFDFGGSYGVGRTGRAHRLCVSDSVHDDHAKVVAYGTSYSFKGITCKSTTAFLRCKNTSGHGFKLSRSAQKLF